MLDRVLRNIPRLQDANVLVGFDTSDDAGVYQLTPECALVQTVDFFTPIVDDPYTYGAIAAANSLSDVYAMGGRPLTALSILAYPEKGDLDDLEAILKGGADKLVEAGCVLLGGHSVRDEEIKFGYAVTGVVHPDRVKANQGAQPGDVLILTKSLGTGIISTALKRGIAREADVEASIASMLKLNQGADPAKAHAMTDVTGFGLAGHAREMACHVTLEIEAAALPVLPGTLEYARSGAVPGGLKANREFAQADMEFTRELPPELEALLFDPQTSGGLLIAIPEADVASLATGVRIGRVVERGAKRLRIL